MPSWKHFHHFFRFCLYIRHPMEWPTGFTGWLTWSQNSKNSRTVTKNLSAWTKHLKHPKNLTNRMESYLNIHAACKWALPCQPMKYKHAILLLKQYNDQEPNGDWLAWNFHQTLPQRETKFAIMKPNKWRIGKNILANRLHQIKNLVRLKWPECDALSLQSPIQKKNI